MYSIRDADFKEKAELFNSFFVKQCSAINDGSEIPSQN